MSALTVLQPYETPSSRGNKQSITMFFAAILGALGVALGAFGAHGLEEQLSSANRLETWKTAVFYHLVHAVLALFAAKTHRPVSSFFLIIGILFFSGPLYFLCLFPDHRWLGWIPPLGGLSFIFGWLSFLFPTPRSHKHL